MNVVLCEATSRVAFLASSRTPPAAFFWCGKILWAPTMVTNVDIVRTAPEQFLKELSMVQGSKPPPKRNNAKPLEHEFTGNALYAQC